MNEVPDQTVPDRSHNLRRDLAGPRSARRRLMPGWCSICALLDIRREHDLWLHPIVQGHGVGESVTTLLTWNFVG